MIQSRFCKYIFLQAPLLMPEADAGVGSLSQDTLGSEQAEETILTEMKTSFVEHRNVPLETAVTPEAQSSVVARISLPLLLCHNQLPNPQLPNLTTSTASWLCSPPFVCWRPSLHLGVRLYTSLRPKPMSFWELQGPEINFFGSSNRTLLEKVIIGFFQVPCVSLHQLVKVEGWEIHMSPGIQSPISATCCGKELSKKVVIHEQPEVIFLKRKKVSLAGNLDFMA